jgi:curved DNA-binding protein CbpA
VVAPLSPAARSATPALSPAERYAIESEDPRTAAATHYEVLGVTGDADAAQVRTAYFAAAKRWHSDAFGARNLDDLAPVVERIFARISEASTVLGDPAKRAEYDVFLERKAKGLPTDVASVLMAEELFHRAQAVLRAQRYADAEALFRQAVELNPAEAEFWAYLGASAHRARGTAAVAEAREAFARARALIPRSLVTEYLEAQLDIGEGELDAAERRLRKILLDKPDHKEAARDLRLLRERKERETATGRGFLGTLWKRK